MNKTEKKQIRELISRWEWAFHHNLDYGDILSDIIEFLREV